MSAELFPCKLCHGTNVYVDEFGLDQICHLPHPCQWAACSDEATVHLTYWGEAVHLCAEHGVLVGPDDSAYDYDEPERLATYD